MRTAVLACIIYAYTIALAVLVWEHCSATSRAVTLLLDLADTFGLTQVHCTTVGSVGCIVHALAFGQACPLICTRSLSQVAGFSFILLCIVSLVFLTVWVCHRIFFCVWSPVGNDFTSWYMALLMRLAKQPSLATCTVRRLFMSCPAVTNRAVQNHTHPESARVRNDASSFMDLFGLILGKRPYFVQMSPSDDRHGRVGCRTFHWAKDVATDYSEYDPEPEDLLTMVDVDMYMDMPEQLANHVHTYCLYSFQPSAVACPAGEYTFTFDQNNNVKYKVSGGAEYVHPLWNYATDVLMAKTCSWWGLYTYTAYNVDRRQVDGHHQLILLTPIRTFSSFLIPLDAACGGSLLKRLCPVVQVEEQYFTRLTVIKSDGAYTSTGKTDSLNCATVPTAIDDTLAAMARIGKVDLMPAQVKCAMDNLSQGEATALTEYHRANRGHVCDTVYPVEESIFKYQFAPKDFDPEARAGLTPFMSPFVLGVYTPDRCKSNDIAAVQGRVLDVKPAEDVLVTPMLLMYMGEFSEFLIPEPHKGHPVDFDTVYDKQPRPAQRNILNNAALQSRVSVTDPIQTFQKAEAYGKISDPRIISTVPGVNKLNYSRYVYAFTTCMRATAWYAFALTPLAVAVRVAAIAINASLLILTDLSRFDGRVSVVLRTLEHICMLRHFAPKYHRELCELQASQKNQRAKTKFGVSYDTGEARASGSAETADFNSLDNAFMAYVTLRTTRVDGHFRSPREAWDGLGIYGGDDGITADVCPVNYTRQCAAVGQVLEAEPIKRGDPGVKFLAREYSPYVWQGAVDSICDVTRQLSKFHVTTSLPANVTPMRKLCEKALSFFLSDANTPIIGNICRLVLEKFPDERPAVLGADGLQGVAYAHSLVPAAVQYPNSDGGWMLAAVQRNIPGFDYERFANWIHSVRATGEGILTPPICLNPDIQHQSTRPVVVNGEVVLPKTAVVPPPSEVKKERMTPEAYKAYQATQACRNGPKCNKAGCLFKH
jgi:hypothetical protein